MSIDFSALFDILVRSPGDLIYHLVINAALILTAGFALAYRKSASNNQQARHLLIGCGVLLLINLPLFAINLIGSTAIFSSSASFALIERLTQALTALWLMWVFIDQDQHFFITCTNIFFSLALLFLTAVVLVIIAIQTTLIDVDPLVLIWQSGALVCALLGLVLILIMRPKQWIVASIIFLFWSAGHLLQIGMPGNESFSMGAVRLAQMLSLPWMIVVVQRLGSQHTAQLQPPAGSGKGDLKRTVDTKPALMDLLLKIGLQESPVEKFKAVVRALSLAVVSDMCYLVHGPNDKDEIKLIAGYDLIREEFLPTKTLSRDDLMHISDAWEDHRVLRLTAEHATTRDADTLTSLLQYHRLGNLFAYPLSLPNQPSTGGVLFLSPYTGKYWGKQTERLMDEINETLTAVLFSPDPKETLKTALAQAQTEINLLLKEKQALNLILKEQESAIRTSATTIQQLKAKYQIEKFEMVKKMEEMKAQVREYNARMSAQKNTLEKLEQIKTEIHQLIDERDKLRIAVESANQRIAHLEKPNGQTGPIRLSMENQILSLDSIAANARLQLAPQLQQKEIELALINPDGRQLIKTDPELVQTMLCGLLNNAIQVSAPQSSVTLSQKLSFETGMLMIEITDVGEGLTPTEQTALFSAEQQAVPGIGSVQSIRDAIRATRLLNGKIWLRSKKGTFTTFRVQLPVRIID